MLWCCSVRLKLLKELWNSTCHHPSASSKSRFFHPSTAKYLIFSELFTSVRKELNTPLLYHAEAEYVLTSMSEVKSVLRLNQNFLCLLWIIRARKQRKFGRNQPELNIDLTWQRFPLQHVQLLCYWVNLGSFTKTGTMGHFQVAPSLCIKARLSAKPLIWKWDFILKQI